MLRLLVKTETAENARTFAEANGVDTGGFTGGRKVRQHEMWIHVPNTPDNRRAVVIWFIADDMAPFPVGALLLYNEA